MSLYHRYGLLTALGHKKHIFYGPCDRSAHTSRTVRGWGGGREEQHAQGRQGQTQKVKVGKIAPHVSLGQPLGLRRGGRGCPRLLRGLRYRDPPRGTGWGGGARGEGEPAGRTSTRARAGEQGPAPAVRVRSCDKRAGTGRARHEAGAGSSARRR